MTKDDVGHIWDKEKGKWVPKDSVSDKMAGVGPIGPKDFSVVAGLEKAERAIKFYSRRLDPTEKEKFLKEARDIVDKAKLTAKSGFDIPRGTEIEWLSWKARGLSYNEYQNYCRSMD